MLVWIGIGVLVLLLAIVVLLALWPKDYYPAESCFHTCPNSGACQDCDCGYP